MPDLIAWLRAQLDDDERKANSVYTARADSPPTSSRHRPDCVEVSVAGGPWRSMSEAEFIETFYEPKPDQRLLREVESKRWIVTVCAGTLGALTNPGAMGDADQVLRFLALPFSDRPGYREEWKP